MGYFVPETAPAKSDPTAKNRVWGFFGESVSESLESRRAALETHRENYGESRKTASGIPLWPSRDPIGESGGGNLYGFVENSPTNKWDYLGNLSFCDCIDFYLESSRALGSGFDPQKPGTGMEYSLPPDGHFLTTKEKGKAIPWVIRAEWNTVRGCDKKRKSCTRYHNDPAEFEGDISINARLLYDSSDPSKKADQRSNQYNRIGNFAPNGDVFTNARLGKTARSNYSGLYISGWPHGWVINIRISVGATECLSRNYVIRSTEDSFESDMLGIPKSILGLFPE